jgi:hypothetical protein
MPLHDHPYSDVNIIYSVVQTGERTTDWGTNSAPKIKRLCNGEYDRNAWMDILLTSFIEGALYRKEDSTWHNCR